MKLFEIKLSHPIGRPRYDEILDRLGYLLKREGLLEPVKNESGYIDAIRVQTNHLEAAEHLAFQRLWERGVPNKARVRAISVQEIKVPQKPSLHLKPASATLIRHQLLLAGLPNIEFLKYRGQWCFVIEGQKPIKTGHKKLGNLTMERWLQLARAAIDPAPVPEKAPRLRRRRLLRKHIG